MIIVIPGVLSIERGLDVEGQPTVDVIVDSGRLVWLVVAAAAVYFLLFG